MRIEDKERMQAIMLEENPRDLRAAAAAAGCAYSTFANGWNPRNTTHRISVEAWVNYMLRTGNTGTLQFVCSLLGGVFVPMPDAARADESLHRLALMPPERVGHLVAEFIRATAPDSEDGRGISVGEARALALLCPPIHEAVEVLRVNVAAAASRQEGDRRRPA